MQRGLPVILLETNQTYLNMFAQLFTTSMLIFVREPKT